MNCADGILSLLIWAEFIGHRTHFRNHIHVKRYFMVEQANAKVNFYELLHVNLQSLSKIERNL